MSKKKVNIVGPPLKRNVFPTEGDKHAVFASNEAICTVPSTVLLMETQQLGKVNRPFSSNEKDSKIHALEVTKTPWDGLSGDNNNSSSIFQTLGDEDTCSKSSNDEPLVANNDDDKEKMWMGKFIQRKS